MKRANRNLKKELSQIILREVDFPPGLFLTIIDVKLVENSRKAKVFISAFPREKTKQALKFLDEHIYKIQQILNKRFKKSSIHPKIVFLNNEEKKEYS